VLGIVGTEGKGLTGLEYGQNALWGPPVSAASSATRRTTVVDQRPARGPGTNLTLTLDSNIQKRSEEVLAAVGRVFEP
jgi:cell division protein FtsI/penicillin-binding protein 2